MREYAGYLSKIDCHLFQDYHFSESSSKSHCYDGLQKNTGHTSYPVKLNPPNRS
jgi:hypothetical protein